MLDNNLFLLWLMGPTSSGKTTLASEITKKLLLKNIPVLHYDGDEIRDIFDVSLGFKNEDRLKVVKTLVYFSNKTIRSGVNVIVSALTANIDAREYVFNNSLNLIVGYVKCSIDICAQRDPKGLYKKAMNNEINTLSGFNSKYLAPPKYDFSVDTEKNNFNQSVNIINQNLKNKGFYK